MSLKTVFSYRPDVYLDSFIGMTEEWHTLML